MKIYVEEVKIVEVGPRDGLQNEKAFVPTDVKVAFITALADAGLRTIEAGAFVHPKWVPSMADTAEVYRDIPKDPGVDYPVLVPNIRGLERAIEVGVKSIAIFTAASETFNKRNINMSIDESFENFVPVVGRARSEGISVRGYVSLRAGMSLRRRDRSGESARGCGTPAGHGLLRSFHRRHHWRRHSSAGSRGDRHAHAGHSREAWRCTFMTPAGTALANTLAALEMGISIFDVSAGGLGGCPFAPGASGNLATEDLVYILDGMGIASGVDLKRLVAASSIIAPYLDHPLPGKYLQSCASSPVKTAPVASVQ